MPGLWIQRPKSLEAQESGRTIETEPEIGQRLAEPGAAGLHEGLLERPQIVELAGELRAVETGQTRRLGRGEIARRETLKVAHRSMELDVDAEQPGTLADREQRQ